MKTLTYTFRLLTRSKSYTLINLSGLAVSLACCIVLARYIHRELSVDAHAIDRSTIIVPLEDNDGNIIIKQPRNTSGVKYYNGDPQWDEGYIPDEDIAEQTDFVPVGESQIEHDGTPYSALVLAADSTFFRFFRYEVLCGTLRLEAPEDALLTESFARRLFGDTDPIGRTFTYDKGQLVTVRGVLKDPASKTSFRFDILLNRSLQKFWPKMTASLLRLRPGLAWQSLNERPLASYRQTDMGNTRFFVLPLTDYYFYPNSDNYSGLEVHGDRQHIHLLLGVCLLLLVVGIVNFVNLYVVQMMRRSRELGVKRIFGISGRQLFTQLWMENALLVTAALFFAWVLVEITALPAARLLDSMVPYTVFDLVLSLSVWLLLPLVTCLYPYVHYRRLAPLVSIRQTGGTRQSIHVRLAFLFIQCLVTFLLVILSGYFARHLHFLLTTDPGFQREGILVAKLQKEGELFDMTEEQDRQRRSRLQFVQQKLDACPYIEQWIASNADITTPANLNKLLNDRDEAVTLPMLWVSPSFFSLYGIELTQGTLPTPENGLDHHLVLNERAMKAFGFEQLDEAFLHSESPLWIFVAADGEVIEGGKKPMPVEAVVRDYYPGHLTQGMPPMAFLVGMNGGDTYQIRCHPANREALLSYLRELEQEVYGTPDFEYEWLTDKVSALYANDRRTSHVYLLFAAIAIGVSALGLLGISLFDIRRRYREIAIRKVNGARLRDLYPLLSRKYAAVLGAAFVVAVPLAYYIIYKYTSDFVVKAPVHAGIFLAALLVVALVAFGTLGWQIRRVASVNPMEVMKTD